MILSPEERLHWYGFRAGWTDWKQLKECVELVTFSSLSRSKALYEPPPSPVFRANARGDEAGIVGSNERPDTVTEDLTRSHIVPTASLNFDLVNEAKGNESGEEWEDDSEAMGTSVSSDKEATVTQALPQRTDMQTAKSAIPERPLAYRDDIREMAKRGKFDLSEINAKSKDEVLENMRRFRRYNVKLHVEVLSNMKRFTSMTKDISLGGLALVDAIPDWVAGYCTVIVSTLDLKHRLEFMCSVVENQEGERCRLEIYPSSDSSELRRWLEKGMPGEAAS